MSLFEAREWWSAVPDGTDEDALPVSRRAMVVANIDNQDPAQDKIVIGTLDGRIRIYAPSQRDYRIEDLVAETDMGKPVLQVSAGRFLSMKSGIALAILHPKSLAVYEVIPVGGYGQGSRYYSVQLQYEHALEAPAHSFVYGQFGGYDKDSICVQSMDGRLSFFEQNAVSFSCALPNILVPVPFAYVSRSDSFVLVNAEMTCESYSYQALGSAHSFHSKNPGSESIQRNWGCHIGQHAMDILIARFIEQTGPSQSDIVVVGERALMALRSQGTISMSKAFSDCNPSCCTSYVVGPSAEVGARKNVIIGTHQKMLMVFRDSQLLWAARTKAVPISIAVTSMGSIPGMIVVMFQSGEIQICYLGTDPSSISRPPTASDDFDYSTVTDQYRNLQKTIRQMQTSGIADSAYRDVLTIDHDVKMDTTMTKSAFVMQPGSDIAIDSSGLPFSAIVTLRIGSERSDPIDALVIGILVGSGFIVEKNTLIVKDIARGDVSSASCQFRVYASKSVMPVDLCIKVSASFSNSDNQMRVSFSSIPLPFEMLGTIVPPIRNSQFFITLDTNRPALTSLKELFPFLNANENQNAFSVKYHCKGIDCTVILSKNAGRFRIQSSELSGLSLLTSQLISRIRWYWNLDGEVQAQYQTNNGPLRISLDGELPLEEFWAVVDSHLKARNAISESSVKMEKLSQQLRAIQKRLLSRFRDATPSSLSHLDVLLKETLNELIAIGDLTRVLEEDMKRTGIEIACCLSLLSSLLIEICNLDNENAACLRAYFSPILDEGIDQGFEERFDAGIAYLLSNVLAKEDKSQPIQLSSDLVIPPDTKRLRKHVKIVIDRLMKGMTIYKEEVVKRKRSSTRKSEEKSR